MINQIQKPHNQENKITQLSYDVITSLIYSIILLYYIFCIYLFFNEDFQNILYLIPPNASTFSMLYIGIQLFFLPFLFMSKFNSSNNFFTIYFSVLFGFVLNIITIPFYDTFAKIWFITMLFIIVILTLFIQKKQFINTLRNLSIIRIILIIFLSFFNFLSFSEIILMGEHINMF